MIHDFQTQIYRICSHFTSWFVLGSVFPPSSTSETTAKVGRQESALGRVASIKKSLESSDLKSG